MIFPTRIAGKQATVHQLTTQIEELQERADSLRDSRDFHDPETASSSGTPEGEDGLYISEISAPTPHFLRCQMSISDAKWTVLLLFSRCQNDLLFCSSHWSFARPATFRASPIPCPLRLSHPDFLTLGAWERTCAQDCSDSMSGTTFSAM